MDKQKKVSKFRNEEEEREFWAKANPADYFDLARPVKIDLSELKPSSRVISLRVPEDLLVSLKKLANKRDVPYQSLTKLFLAERVERERALAS